MAQAPAKANPKTSIMLGAINDNVTLTTMPSILHHSFCEDIA
jgi:hypothetical protein